MFKYLVKWNPAEPTIANQKSTQTFVSNEFPGQCNVPKEYWPESGHLIGPAQDIHSNIWSQSNNKCKSKAGYITQVMREKSREMDLEIHFKDAFRAFSKDDEGPTPLLVLKITRPDLNLL